MKQAAGKIFAQRACSAESRLSQRWPRLKHCKDGVRAVVWLALLQQQGVSIWNRYPWNLPAVHNMIHLERPWEGKVIAAYLQAGP